MSFIDDMLSTYDPIIDATLGDTVTYTPDGGSPASVVGIFDREYVDSLDATGWTPRFEMAVDAVTSPAAGDTLVFDGVTYTVRAVLLKEPDHNRTTLVLGKN